MRSAARLLEVFRAIQRASTYGYDDAVTTLIREIEAGGAHRVSCLTVDGVELVHGKPIGAELREQARRAAWMGPVHVADGVAFVPLLAHIRGGQEVGERFPIAVLVVEPADVPDLEQLATFAGDALLLARDRAGAASDAGMANLAAYRQIARRWMEIGRARGVAVSALAIALDGLAEVNQRIGFAAGDEALYAVAELLVHELPDAAARSRIGGASMAVLLAGANGEQACATAARVGEAFDRDLGRRLPDGMRLSIGVATLGDLPDDDLLRAARVALATARREERPVVAWSSSLRNEPDDAPLPDIETESGAEHQRILAAWRLFEALCHTTQFDELVARTLRALLLLFRADRAALWHQLDGQWVQRTTIERDERTAPRRVSERETALVAEAANAPDLVIIPERSRAETIAIALRNADRVTGVLHIVNDGEPLRVDDGDLAFLQTFARHIGRVIGEFQALGEARRQQEQIASRLRQQTIDLRRLVRTSSGLLGNDASMQAVFRMIERSRTSNFPLVITGETGTGKEAVARLVHRTSNRRGPFIVVDCGAIPAGLLESELFGHEKGSFTGADTRKIGHFEQADSGTIFLDEIGELPIELQPKLLRVLQESTIRRLGGRDVITVDFRLIAATHRNLAAMVDEGRFRQDLYFRLRVLEIEVPPLRARGDDILLLALHSARQYCAEVGREMMTISPDAEQLMRSYPWPGNVRELQNVLRRAVLVAPGEELTAKDLQLTTKDVQLERPTGSPVRKREPPPRSDDAVRVSSQPTEELDEAVARWFWHAWVQSPSVPPQDAIEAFLLRNSLRTAGTISDAAKRLEMHPETFVTHLERLGDPEASRAIRNDALASVLDHNIATSTPHLRDRILRVLLTELLVYCRGNKSEMARHLGWGRQTLMRQLRRIEVAGRSD